MIRPRSPGERDAVRACYLVQSHREPTQLERLVATLKRGSPECRVLIVHDSTGATIDGARWRGWADVELLVVPGPAERGRLSLLDPYFAGLDLLRRRGYDYDWLIYLSAQDYPVQPLRQSESALADADCDGFLKIWPALRRERGKVRDRRYRYRYYDAPAWAATPLRALRWANRLQSKVHLQFVYGPRVGVRLARVPLPAGWTLYRGKQWSTLRRACAEWLLDAVARERAVVDYFRRTICPDEALVQTLLVNAGRFRLVADDLRYSDWTGSRDGHPRVLGVADLPVITSGRFHFARKFDPGADAEVLDRLDLLLAN
jgi:hypothetical protein